jgi:hypothetical protein
MAKLPSLSGVCWHKQRNKWVAFATVSGRQLHLGCFDTPAEAHAAYLEAKARLNRGQRKPRPVTDTPVTAAG